MSMGETVITIFVIFVAGVVIFVFPLTTMANRTDDVTQQLVDSATKEFGSTVVAKGKLTEQDYTSFVEALNSTGNTYDIEMELKIKDQNAGKKTSQTTSSKTGENPYYSIFTSDLEERLEQGGNEAEVLFNEGDIFIVSVKIKGKTIGDLLNQVMYAITQNDIYTISSSYVGTVPTNGSLAN